MKRKITLIAALLCTLAAGYALGQNAAQDDTEFQADLDSAFNSFRMATGKDTLEGAKKNADNIEKAVGDAKRTRMLTQDAVAGAYTREDSKAAVRLQALHTILRNFT